MSQPVIIKLQPLIAPGAEFYYNPIFLAAIVTFLGVLMTVIVSTRSNFILNRRRNKFEEDLAERKMEIDLRISNEKLEREASMKREELSTARKLKRLDFQKSTLIELQESLIDLTRALREDAQGEGNVRDFWDQNARYSMQVSRTANLDLRIMAVQVRQSFVDALKLNGDRLETALEEASRRLADAIIQIGAEIQKIDEEEAEQVGG